MSILLSKSSEYARQAILYIASLEQKKPVRQQEISKALSIPSPFLGKILQSLAHTGFLVSYKGKSGGFLLAKSTKNISLYDIIKIIEGEHFLEGCFLGFPGCQEEAPCPLHNHWKKEKENIINMLKESKLSELGKELDSKIKYILNFSKQ